MSPEVSAIIIAAVIVIAFVAGLLVGAHNSKTVAADVAVAKAEIVNLKNDVSGLKAKPAAPAATSPAATS